MDYIEEFVLPVDPELAKYIAGEEERQLTKIELIASENFVSRAVMAAQGSALTNKYAEGYPGRRYYGGCEWVDKVEELARARAQKLFSAEHVNVQPHSGAQANTAVYFALAKPGETILGMNLSHGGHLTHGSPVNISGKYFNFVPYGVEAETERIDYEQLAELAREAQPKIIVSGASAYPRIIDFEKIAAICKEVGALMVVDMAHIAGLVAAGLHPNPCFYADVVTTTTHKTLRGPRGGMILCQEKYARDIDRAVFPGTQGGPLMHVIAAKAVSFQEALSPDFKTYQEQIIKNAQALAQALLAKGYRLVSGGTDNHLLLVDLRNKEITGKEAEALLDNAGVTVNKNTVPFDSQSAFITSGIRMGTAAITTRGMKEKETEKIAEIFDLVITHRQDQEMQEKAKLLVKELTTAFPLAWEK